MSRPFLNSHRAFFNNTAYFTHSIIFHFVVMKNVDTCKQNYILDDFIISSPACYSLSRFSEMKIVTFSNYM